MSTNTQNHKNTQSKSVEDKIIDDMNGMVRSKDGDIPADKINVPAVLRKMQDLRNTVGIATIQQKHAIETAKALRIISKTDNATPAQYKWMELFMQWIYTSYVNDEHRRPMPRGVRFDLGATAASLISKDVPLLNRSFCEKIALKQQRRPAALKSLITSGCTHS